MKKIISIIKKSLIEQIRSYWILILTVTMAPFFVFVYYLINESQKPSYDVLIVNADTGVQQKNYGKILIEYTQNLKNDTMPVPLKFKEMGSKQKAIELLKNKDADALIVIPDNFSEIIEEIKNGIDTTQATIELIGDLSDIKYMISAVWTSGIAQFFVYQSVNQKSLFSIKETALGLSGKMDDFDLYMPGLLILSLIMLMFPATIAFVMEVENKTMLRLKLSEVTTFQLITGISIIQVLIGVLSIALTIVCALAVGFNISGNILNLTVVVILTSISMIAFSLIVAAMCKTVNEVLIIGNFPLLLFMFFTGAAFPINSTSNIEIFNYPLTFQSLMSPTPAVLATKKILVMGMGLNNVIPELSAIVVLTIIYFIVGLLFFHYRHMRLN